MRHQGLHERGPGLRVLDGALLDAEPGGGGEVLRVVVVVGGVVAREGGGGWGAGNHGFEDGLDGFENLGGLTRGEDLRHSWEERVISVRITQNKKSKINIHKKIKNHPNKLPQSKDTPQKNTHTNENTSGIATAASAKNP